MAKAAARRALNLPVPDAGAEPAQKGLADPDAVLLPPVPLECRRDWEARAGFQAALAEHGIRADAKVEELATELVRRLVANRLFDDPQWIALVLRLAAVQGRADELRETVRAALRASHPELLELSPELKALVEDLRSRLLARRLVDQTLGAFAETDTELFDQTLEQEHLSGDVERLEARVEEFIRKDFPELVAKAPAKSRAEPYPFLRLLVEEEMGGWNGTRAEYKTALDYLYRGATSPHTATPHEQWVDELASVGSSLVRAIRHPDANTAFVAGLLALASIPELAGVALLIAGYLVVRSDGAALLKAFRERADRAPEALNRAQSRVAFDLLTMVVAPAAARTLHRHGATVAPESEVDWSRLARVDGGE